MAFQIDEKMMAANRAIITRNKCEEDLLRNDTVKYKPGMIHYCSDTQKLWLSIEPTRVIDENGVEQIRTFKEIGTLSVGESLKIILQKREPENVISEDTYWYKIDSSEEESNVLITESYVRIMTEDERYIKIPDEVESDSDILITEDGLRIRTEDGRYIVVTMMELLPLLIDDNTPLVNENDLAITLQIKN